MVVLDCTARVALVTSPGPVPLLTNSILCPHSNCHISATRRPISLIFVVVASGDRAESDDALGCGRKCKLTKLEIGAFRTGAVPSHQLAQPNFRKWHFRPQSHVEGTLTIASCVEPQKSDHHSQSYWGSPGSCSTWTFLQAPNGPSSVVNGTRDCVATQSALE